MSSSKMQYNGILTFAEDGTLMLSLLPHNPSEPLEAALHRRANNEAILAAVKVMDARGGAIQIERG